MPYNRQQLVLQSCTQKQLATKETDHCLTEGAERKTDTFFRYLCLCA